MKVLSFLGLMFMTIHMNIFAQTPDTLYVFDFDESVQSWTITGNETGFRHGLAIPPQGSGSAGNPTFCLFIIDWDLEGAAVDTAYSPVLDLSELNPDALVRLSFDFMHTDMLGDKFEVVYRTSETEPWQILVEALPSTVENEEFVFFHHYLFLSEDFFINSLQIGFAYTPEWGFSAGAAFDNVVFEIFQDNDPPQVSYISGLTSSGSHVHLTLTVTDDSELPDSVQGTYLINEQPNDFVLFKTEYESEIKYKGLFTIDAEFTGLIPVSVILTDEYENEQTVDFTVNSIEPYTTISEDFGEFEDFTNDLGDWTVINVNRSSTFFLGTYVYPNQGSIPGFFVFNNQATEPPMPNTEFAYSGTNSLLCMASLNSPNNNWIISPPIATTADGDIEFSFWARSIQAMYGLDRFRVMVSETGNDPSDFAPIDTNSETYIEAPVEWTRYSYSFPFDKGYFAIQGVSDDNFGLLIDSVSFSSQPDVTNIYPLEAHTASISIYPNPANEKSAMLVSLPDNLDIDISITNLAGQRIASVAKGYHQTGKHSFELNVSTLKPGIYFVVMKNNNSIIQSSKLVVTR
ncbi:MAG: T9SS C-terminal target domain-containing protein [Bacteroidetes bacterium]|nr:MAG: T9SS C-terminal target domain-containing protein [Bacteroidota bacterium]